MSILSVNYGNATYATNAKGMIDIYCPYCNNVIAELTEDILNIGGMPCNNCDAYVKVIKSDVESFRHTSLKETAYITTFRKFLTNFKITGNAGLLRIFYDPDDIDTSIDFRLRTGVLSEEDVWSAAQNVLSEKILNSDVHSITFDSSNGVVCIYLF